MYTVFRATLRMNDTALIILSYVDFDDKGIIQKRLTLVCKQWKLLLENCVTNYDFTEPGWLSIGTIAANINKINWLNVSFRNDLSEEFIEKFQDRLNWDRVSSHQNLSEWFIEKHQDKVNWYNISYGQRHLSIGFIWRFRNEVDWLSIFEYQELFENPSENLIQWLSLWIKT